MKRFFLILALLPLLGMGQHSETIMARRHKAAAPAVLSSTFCTGLSMAGGTTSAIDTTGAKIIVLAMGYNYGSTVTISDNKSNGAPTKLTYYGVTPSGQGTQIAYWLSPTVGTGHTFTLTGAVIDMAVCVIPIKNVAGLFDSGTDSGLVNASGTCQPGSINPGSGPHIVIASLATNGTSGTPTINSSFSVTGSTPFSGGNNYGEAGAYLVQSPNGAAINPTWTSSSVNISCSIASFK